jgi:hypothetical protein
MPTLRRAVAAGSIAWAALVPATAFAASQPSHGVAWSAFIVLVYGAGSVVCHQLPERSFHLWSVQLPVCARCTGIYAGAALTAVAASMWPRAMRLHPDRGRDRWTLSSGARARALLAAAAVPTALTLVFEWTTKQMPSNLIRSLAGGLLGAAVMLVLLAALSAAPPAPVEPKQ